MSDLDNSDTLVFNIKKLAPSDFILIVDDNTANLSVLSELLDNAGFNVRIAKDGNSALKKVAIAKPILILLDIMMPDMDGFETCERLKLSVETRDIPIIFMTALSNTADKVKGLSIGGADYITKPFQQDEVLARLLSQLKLHILSREISQQNFKLQAELKQRRTAEAALQSAIQQLEATQKKVVAQEKLASLGSLASGIAHELCNPLNFIINYAESSEELLNPFKEATINFAENSGLEEEGGALKLIQDIHENLSIIHQHGIRAEKIINCMMQHAQFENNSYENIYLNNLISESLKLAYSQFSSKESDFDVSIYENYDESIGSIDAIASDLNRVFINLLNNAFYAVHDRKKKSSLGNNNSPYKPEVWLQTTRYKDNIEIRIRNNGEAIPAELKEQVFQPFFTTKPPGKGIGLGLSLSYDIVVGRHGGSISLSDNSYPHVEFIIFLPCSLPDLCSV